MEHERENERQDQSSGEASLKERGYKNTYHHHWVHHPHTAHAAHTHTSHPHPTHSHSAHPSSLHISIRHSTRTKVTHHHHRHWVHPGPSFVMLVSTNCRCTTLILHFSIKHFTTKNWRWCSSLSFSQVGDDFVWWRIVSLVVYVYRNDE